MKNSLVGILVKLFCLFGFVSAVCFEAKAEMVFKCETGGKINFTSAPKDGQKCHPVELRVLQPNPEEVARELEKKRVRDEEDKKKDEQAQIEKMQRQTEIALRKAKTADEALRVLRDSPPMGNGRSRTWMGAFPKPEQGLEGRYSLQVPPKERPEIVKLSPNRPEKQP